MGVFFLIYRLSRGYSTPQGEQWTLSRLVRTELELGASVLMSLYSERPTVDWSGQGESDCLIKTKRCDGLKRC